MKKWFLLVMMCLMALTMQAQKRCVVLDFQLGTNVTEEESDAFSYCFRSNFQPNGYTKLEQLLVTITILDFGYSRTDMTRQQIIKVGRELESNIIVVGTLNKFMDEYSVDILVIDVAKGTTTANDNATFQKADYRDEMEKTAKRLASKLGGGTVSTSSVDDSTGYTDLGLPSGTKWKNFNATGFYTYDEAVFLCGNRLPTKQQWEELRYVCHWSWNGSGYKFTGPNGNSIVLPASGCRYCGGSVDDVGSYGLYWSSTPQDSDYAWGLSFSSGRVSVGFNDRCVGRSVRLVSSSSVDDSTGYTDLGLPSGTKWKNFNATGFYTYHEAVSQFGNRLPTKQQWEELEAECQWSWNGSGYKVTGPNGNSIVLPASGVRYCGGSVGSVGSVGSYWSSTPGDSDRAWSLFFNSGGLIVYDDYRCGGLSVRLVQD